VPLEVLQDVVAAPVLVLNRIKRRQGMAEVLRHQMIRLLGCQFVDTSHRIVLSGSVLQSKLGAVEQGPENVGQCSAIIAGGTAAAKVGDEALRLRRRQLARQDCQEERFDAPGIRSTLVS
jgi:hypothetical protein